MKISPIDKSIFKLNPTSREAPAEDNKLGLVTFDYALKGLKT